VKAMILAAGRGERMRPLTDRVPKPMLQVAGIPLIEHHIRRLAAAGLRELVVNVSHLGRQVMDYCGDGRRWGVTITWSPEDVALETAGGIVQALPSLGPTPFLVVNGDIWTDFPFAQLAVHTLRPAERAHLVMVANPPQHPAGDFRVDGEGWVRELAGGAGWTYSGVGLYTPGFFAGVAPGKRPLRPLLDAAIAAGELGGRVYEGEWEDVGTPARLEALDRAVRQRGMGKGT